jgi:tetratricopeptide (TPR) repeat protein
MKELKPLSKEALPGALEKARHYRLLNQPWQAESICRDILKADPGNQQVIYTMILAITDQFEGKVKKSLSKALKLVSDLNDEYQKEYITGLIYERQATAAFKRQTPRAGYIAYEYVNKAMDHYEKAEKVRPESNDESILRWNACVRFLGQHEIKPAPDTERIEPFLDV